MGMLEEQVALVVGAAGGIGRAVVRRYLAEGASVVAVDRDQDRLDKLRGEFGAGGRLAVFAGDAAAWSTSEAMVAKAVEEFGGLDVLVSCVGVWDQAVRLVDIPGERLGAAFDECLRGNVGSVLLNVRAALSQLAARNGRVVVTGSFASYRTSGGGVLYTSAKHAVVGLVSQLAYELAPRIRVNGVAPGVAQTVMSGLRALDQCPTDAVLPGTENALPLGTIPDADDYGALYALLGSATASAAMTGTMVAADSGLLVRGMAQASLGGDL
ncbi:SDR family NAD(P)-dependent oxidoreductase [Streptomyces sp. NBC_00145]|uniref:SDR family NAD(P)-dependent oxidoreductase n=1 Tax=Streptomyces sp. NBC_00145 TaxID=2975666 RepID=UPI002E184BA6